MPLVVVAAAAPSPASAADYSGVALHVKRADANSLLTMVTNDDKVLLLKGTEKQFTVVTAACTGRSAPRSRA